MENQPKLNSTKEVIAFLAERFPQCFSAEGEARPLKIGIFQDLVERVQGEMSLSKTQLRSALRLYTSSWRYLYGIKAGATRVDLDGNACGQLDETSTLNMRANSLKKPRHACRRNANSNRRKSVKRVKRPRLAVRVSPCANLQSREPARSVRNKPARPQPARHTSAPREESRPEQPKPVTDTAALQVGQSIKVTAGKNAMDATILEIGKDGVRVQLASGLAMIVRAEHLQF